MNRLQIEQNRWFVFEQSDQVLEIGEQHGVGVDH